MSVEEQKEVAQVEEIMRRYIYPGLMVLGIREAAREIVAARRRGKQSENDE